MVFLIILLFVLLKGIRCALGVHRDIVIKKMGLQDVRYAEQTDENWSTSNCNIHFCHLNVEEVNWFVCRLHAVICAFESMETQNVFPVSYVSYVCLFGLHTAVESVIQSLTSHTPIQGTVPHSVFN